MKTAAVICELNPLHNGHKYILTEAKRNADCVIAVMSGNFSQRSEVTVFDKYARASDALRSGANIVVELPFPWSSASGPFFAEAGVNIAERLGADELEFASESGDISELRHAAEVADEFDKATTERSPDGIATEKARFALEHGVAEGIFSSPNNILGVEYIRQCKTVTPRTVKRIEGDCIASATELRLMLREGGNLLRYIPIELGEAYADRINNGAFASSSCLADIERQAMLLGFADTEAFESTGGLGDRLISSANATVNGEAMLNLARTKKYTDSRIRRAALYMTLDVKEADVRRMPEFTYLLGADEIGREYLSQIRKTVGSFIVTKPADVAPSSRQLELMRKADRLWCECSSDGRLPDYFVKQHPVVL